MTNFAFCINAELAFSFVNYTQRRVCLDHSFYAWCYVKHLLIKRELHCDIRAILSLQHLFGGLLIIENEILFYQINDLMRGRVGYMAWHLTFAYNIISINAIVNCRWWFMIADVTVEIIKTQNSQSILFHYNRNMFSHKPPEYRLSYFISFTNHSQ